ncbi:hypothetical protein AAD018_010005 [Aestuariibius insulae]|uniref:hypothetical protein n=1 Tax=Aestuariibius insulae TaxID=2058287 RepID=UPI00345F0D82
MTDLDNTDERRERFTLSYMRVRCSKNTEDEWLSSKDEVFVEMVAGAPGTKPEHHRTTVHRNVKAGDIRDQGQKYELWSGHSIPTALTIVVGVVEVDDGGEILEKAVDFITKISSIGASVISGDSDLKKGLKVTSAVGKGITAIGDFAGGENDNLGHVVLHLDNHECYNLLRSKRLKPYGFDTNIRTVHLDPNGQGRYTVYFLLESNGGTDRFNQNGEAHEIYHREKTIHNPSRFIPRLFPKRFPRALTIRKLEEDFEARWSNRIDGFRAPDYRKPTQSIGRLKIFDRDKNQIPTLHYDHAFNVLQEEPLSSGFEPEGRKWFRPAVHADKLRSFKPAADVPPLAFGRDIIPGGRYEGHALAMFQWDNVVAVYPERPASFYELPRDPDQGLELECLHEFPKDATSIDIHRLSEAEDGFFAYQPNEDRILIYRYVRRTLQRSYIGLNHQPLLKIAPGEMVLATTITVPEDDGNEIQYDIVASGHFDQRSNGSGAFILYRRNLYGVGDIALLYPPKKNGTGVIRHRRAIEPDWDEIYPMGRFRALFVKDGGVRMEIKEVPSWQTIAVGSVKEFCYVNICMTHPRSYLSRRLIGLNGTICIGVESTGSQRPPLDGGPHA